MSRYIEKSAKDIWETEQQPQDEKQEGRIPTFLGKFEHKGQYHDFDEDVLDGGFYRGVNIISGFPGEGKSSVAVQIGTRQAEAGFRVLYISLEQNALEIVEKSLGILTGRQAKYWEDVKFKKDDEFESMKNQGKAYLEDYLSERFKLIYANNMPPEDLVEIIRDRKDRYDIIYVDNFQNVDMVPGKEVEELRKMSNEVMQLINESQKCALVWLSQLTQPGKYYNPLTAQINYAKKLDQDAALRIVVYRKEKESFDKKKDDEVIDVNKSFIGVVKNRKSQKPLAKIEKAEFFYDNLKGRIGEFVLRTPEERRKHRLAYESLETDPAPFDVKAIYGPEYDPMEEFTHVLTAEEETRDQAFKEFFGV